MKKLFKVVSRGVTYGTYKTIDKARKLRSLLRGKMGADDITIRVTDEE